MLNNKQKNIIDKSKIVSFDIFDTLIDRMLYSPFDVFEVVQRMYNKENQNAISDFKSIRINAEKKARNELKKEEISLVDIYEYIKRENKKLDVEKLMELEKSIEISICRRKNNNIDILDYCYHKNKIVVISSDMYLPKKTIETILKDNKIEYEKLYLSSDLNKTKRTGSLFQKIITDYKISPKEIVHIGDNKKSDYIIPKLNGLNAILINDNNNKNYNSILSNYSMKCAINDLFFDKQKEKSYFYCFGYRYLGIIMLSFCRYLAEKTPNSNLIFLAREGKFIKKCFDEIYPNNKSKYMYISRKSASAGLLEKYDSITDMINSQSISPKESIETFLKRWDLLCEKNNELLKVEGIELETPLTKINKMKVDSLLDKMKNNSNVHEKSVIFKEYINSLEFDLNTSIVDIGWSGTMQDLIQKQLDDENIKINGYYLGVRNIKKSNYKHGFLFDGENDDIEILSRSMTGFLEIIFSADHGTTLGYKKEKNSIVPVLDSNDICDSELMLIQEIQKGCIDFINKYKDDSIILAFNELRDSYIPLFKFCIYPRLKDINEFKKFYVVDEEEYDLVGNKMGILYLFNIKKFKNDYILSCWKNAFLKSIFKIDLPYNLFFKFAYKRRR